MGRFRPALMLMTAGIVAKSAAIAIYDIFHPPILAKLVLVYDPLATRFADRVLPQFFPRGIAPNGEAFVYEALLVLGFAAECFVLGLMMNQVRRFIGPRDCTDRRRSCAYPPDA
jgi:hypothetical protein